MDSGNEEEDGYSSISGSTLEKARLELNEEPSNRAAAVQELRRLIVQGESQSVVRESLVQ